jgi:hypothetical protein
MYGDGCINYPELMITQHIHIATHHIAPHIYAQLLLLHETLRKNSFILLLTSTH